MGFPWILERREWRLSKRVPKIVIFLRIAEARRWASGPVKEDLFLSEIIPFISSASFKASLYSLIHESDEDAIGLCTNHFQEKNYEQRELTSNNKNVKLRDQVVAEPPWIGGKRDQTVERKEEIFYL